MKSLLIIGAGSFSTEVEELARLAGFNDIVFLDDKPSSFSSPIIGSMRDIGPLRARYDSAIVALGSNTNRKRFHEELKRFDYKIPTLIHPTAFISPDAILSSGCIIRTHAIVSRFAKLGEGVIVNIGGLIDHHCEIGEFSMILPGAVVRGCRKLEPGSWMKANEVVE